MFVFDWRDDPRKDDEWYRKQCETLDLVIVAQEIDRNYEASVSNAFIPGELVSAALSKGPADIKPVGGLRIGIDVARFGNDRSVISFRRGRVLLKQVVLSKLDVMQVAARARAEIRAYNETPEQIAVDTIGIGSGAATDGQVLVINDLVGITQRDYKHNRRYGAVGTAMRNAVAAYVKDVRAGAFPSSQQAFSLPPEELQLFERMRP